jgi:hypothetical protein
VAGGAEAWNTYVLNREVYPGDRTAAIAENPWLAEHPEITLSLDFLLYWKITTSTTRCVLRTPKVTHSCDVVPCELCHMFSHEHNFTALT